MLGDMEFVDFQVESYWNLVFFHSLESLTSSRNKAIILWWCVDLQVNLIIGFLIKMDF